MRRPRNALPFSVVVIARNEAATLPRLIVSLLPFLERGGRMIVVDTGSTDGTVAIAKAAKLDVYEEGSRFRRTVTAQQRYDVNFKIHAEDGEAEFLEEGDTYFDFSAARNYAASKSPTDMIAMPDCDEVFTTLDVDRMCAAIKDGAEQFTYPFVYSHFADGRPELQFTHSKFYDRRALKWKGIVHECLQVARLKAREDGWMEESLPNPKLVTFGADVIHLEHFQNHGTNRGQYITGLAVDLLANPDNDRNTHYLAREFYYTKRYWSAIRLFEKHIAMERAWKPEVARSMCLIGDCYAALSTEHTDHIDEATHWWMKSFRHSPAREPLIRMAEYHYRRAEHAETAAFAAASLAIPRRGAYFEEERHYGAYPHELLYWALYYMGEIDNARVHHLAAHTFEPTNAKYMSEMEFFYPK